MNAAQNPNADLLLAAARKLDPLLDRIVFLGGCAAGLLITDPGAAPVRPTLNVDAIVEIASYTEFMALEARLRQLGFEQPHVAGAPLCRWVNEDVMLDLMHTDSAILGFSNRWYPQALENAVTVKIGGRQIRLISAPYFVATKLEAFHGRGQFDYRLSRDVEDIVTVLDGRKSSRKRNKPQPRFSNISAVSSRHCYRTAIFSKLCRDICCQMRQVNNVSQLS